MGERKFQAPFTVGFGCEEYYVLDDDGYQMAKCEARFDSATNEFYDHDEARARAALVARALNLAHYLAVTLNPEASS